MADKLTLEYAKKYLRVSFDDDDDMIYAMLETAKAYVVSGTSKSVNQEDGRFCTLVLLVLKELYDERGLTQKSDRAMRRLVDSFFLQLSLEEDEQSG